MTAFKNVVVESADPGIRIIKISRPKALNALNTETLRELRLALEAEAQNEGTRVIILTGEGEKAFIAGADIAEMKDKDAQAGVEFAQLGHSVTKLLELMPKPTIAAVNGFALGGGTEMAIACDFIVASENAVFGQPEVSLGIIPGFGATLRLAKFVGWPMAKELIFSGRRIKADEALSIGLVNHVYPTGELLPKTFELARSISLNSRSAVERSKSLLNDFSESIGLNYKLDAEAQAFGQLFGTKDQREGMTAFVEKRKPTFQGL
ncbi:MAG TPA: enoyl-CoA hydratase-related protein [Bdellovibrionota bacterium]|nr:enoyl-CoA hydratase-related protein [Bdellovibrionota bacterium]